MPWGRVGERTGSLAAAVIFTGVLLPGLISGLKAVEPAGQRAVAVVVAVAYLIAGIGAVAAVGESGGPVRRWAAYGTLSLGAVLVLLLGTAMSWLLVSALTVVAALRPWWETAAVTTATVATVTAAGAGVDTAVVLVSVVVAVSFAVALAETNTALRAAHAQIDELVAARERSRMSRDLHDILGHSLTTIAVKAGLARQLLDAGAVPRAAAEVADVERLARQAFGDVRTTVAGSRETTLAGELAAAREALLAAGITGDLPASVESVRPDLRRPFAHVLREGVTNVIRHSAASRVTVRLEPELISVRDNGSGAGEFAEGAGLRGLRERLAASGATLAHGPATGGGYELTARTRRVD
jgi:two-component system, NarL family, sensor histidine kinase DesK